MPTQLFHPESHDFLNGGPSLRRKFIDWGLFYTVPHFLEKWQRFHHVLKQRNAALYQKQSPSSIYSWDIEFSSLGEELSQYRVEYVEKLIAYVEEWITLLVGKPSIQFHYYAGWNSTESLMASLKNNFDKDVRYGYTTQGPHRFDLRIQFRDLPVTGVFSRGEQKRLICALYLAQGKIFEEATQQGCLYLFDDILSELDEFYQSKVLDALLALDAQIFVTSLSASLVRPLLSANEANQFSVTDGAVKSNS